MSNQGYMCSFCPASCESCSTAKGEVAGLPSRLDRDLASTIVAEPQATVQGVVVGMTVAKNAAARVARNAAARAAFAAEVKTHLDRVASERAAEIEAVESVEVAREAFIAQVKLQVDEMAAEQVVARAAFAAEAETHLQGAASKRAAEIEAEERLVVAREAFTAKVKAQAAEQVAAQEAAAKEKGAAEATAAVEAVAGEVVAKKEATEATEATTEGRSVKHAAAKVTAEVVAADNMAAKAPLVGSAFTLSKPKTADTCEPFTQSNASSHALFSLDFSVLPAGARPYVCGRRRPSSFVLVEHFFSPEEVRLLVQNATFESRPAGLGFKFANAISGVPVPRFASQRLGAFIAPSSPRRRHIGGGDASKHCKETTMGRNRMETESQPDSKPTCVAESEARVLVPMLDSISIDQHGACADILEEKERGDIPPQFEPCVGPRSHIAREEPMYMYEDGGKVSSSSNAAGSTTLAMELQ